MSDFRKFHRFFLLEHGDTSLKKIKKFHPFIKELYAGLYHCYILEALSLLKVMKLLAFIFEHPSYM